ncbi:MAG: hypothetical protein R3E39_20580 [Anaerolineae bacterium]
MGVRCHIALFFPVENMGTALAELNKLAYQPNNQSCVIQLSNNNRVYVYCRTGRPPAEYFDIFGRKVVCFDTVLLFPADDVIAAYINANNELVGSGTDRQVTIDGITHYPVGYLSIIIATGTKFGEITISSVVSSQNQVILCSPSLHASLINILTSANGVAGLINNDGAYDNLLLTDTSCVVRIDFDKEERFRDGNDIDEIVRSILDQLENP